MSGRTIATSPAGHSLPQVKIGSIEDFMAALIALVHRWEDDGGSVRDEWSGLSAPARLRDSSPPPPL